MGTYLYNCTLQMNISLNYTSKLPNITKLIFNLVKEIKFLMDF